MGDIKLPQGSDYHGSGKYILKPLEDKLIMCEYKGMKRKELEKFADRMRIDRNSFLIEKQSLEEKVLKLETDLYFCNRNNKIEEIVDERTKVETR
jgi:hypothetical protein